MKLERLVAAFGSILLAGFAPNASAVATLGFQVDGGAVTFCADGAACDGTAAGDGVVSFSGALGGVFGVNVTTGSTVPALPGSHMDLNTVNLQTLAGGTHTLEIRFSEIGFSAPGNATASFAGTLTANGSTVQYTTYFDAGNVLFDLGTLMTDSLQITGPAFAGTQPGTGPLAGPFSMTQRLVLSTTGLGTTLSGDFEVQLQVPEPGALGLIAIGLLGVGFARRRRKS
jgi:hypothetical protein